MRVRFWAATTSIQEIFLMITIDGSQGEGGGQIVRSTLALAAIAGKPVTINNLRAGRDKPGLQKQHLCAVLAVREICDAAVDGAEIGSRQLVFSPNEIKGGEYVFRIGTAGSTTLVAQTVLLPLAFAMSASKVLIEGGTHNPFAPPIDYLQQVYLPLIRKMGLPVDVKLLKYGFYPAGGGQVEIVVQPAFKLEPLRLLERGDLKSRHIGAVVAKLPKHIAERELDTIRRRAQWRQAKYQTIEVSDSISAGNVAMIQLDFEHVRELFLEIGKQGVSAEQVAARVLRQAKQYLKTEAPVGPYLADQLLLPAAIAAVKAGAESEFVTGPLTLHSKTHVSILQQVLDVRIDIEQLDDQKDPNFGHKACRVRVRPRAAS